jgi:16S rRNA (cytidine1402-2'-O)-methyltransferase
MKDQEKLQPGLYMVSTPIGNLEDLSFRACRVLANCQWIAAEDTRETRKLLDSQGIKTELISLHEHTSQRKIEELSHRLAHGETGAYVSDAGTPGLCDPGAELVAAAARLQVPVIPVPGPSAPIALLSACGFSGSKFSFRGFFPRENRERIAWAKQAAASGGLQLFFESPHRIKECLEFLAGNFSAAPLVVGRELTKKFETITRGLAAEVAQKLLLEEPRGEYVLALDLPEAQEKATALGAGEISSLLTELAALGASQKTLTRVGISHGLAKNAAYELALKTPR